ncbi:MULTISPECIES: NAD(P)/FAD-dependent oxidoreductase [unclassified Nocardioides]|uniref:NAD(P)/FAD-dependent oxidoreductase n=1 Tax=unclassified Nocardioides TaxID=2615069 RepID=UPI00360B4662
MTVRPVETIIIGGGIAGVALSYFLAQHGARDMLVLDAHTLGSGCTAGSLGGVRQQFSTAAQVELAVRGRTFWQNFADRFETPFDYRDDGYLLFTGSPETVRKLEDAARVQVSAGAPNVEMLEPPDISELLPWLRTEGILAAAWTPEDGRINPTDGVYVMASAARRAGVRYLEHCRVGQIRPGRPWVVETSDGAFTAQRVVVTAGLGSPALLRPFGLEVPISPMPIHYGFTTPVLQGQPLPLMLDLDTGFCVEREQDGAMVTILESAFAQGPDEMLVGFAELAETRAPILTEVGIRGTVTASADATGGDGHPFAGEVEPGLWTMTGFDGHGTMQGPAVAEMTANLMQRVLDPVLNPSTFDPRRVPAEDREWLRAAKTVPV